MVSYLRCCAGCGGSFAVAYTTNEAWFCPKCTAALPEFNPQPYGRGRPDDQSVRYGPYLVQYVVLDRKGDMVTIRPMGNPDAMSFEVHVNNLRPMWVTYGR
jgi:hypothetical protein